MNSGSACPEEIARSDDGLSEQLIIAAINRYTTRQNDTDNLFGCKDQRIKNVTNTLSLR